MESKNLLGWSDTDQTKRDYFEVCEEICSDENLFSNFKQNPKYTPILEHVDYDLGWKYFNIICSDYGNDLLKKIMDLIPVFKRNDLYGNPLKYNYPIFGDISPTTLRYIKTLMDIISRGVDLNGKDVVEIGGGYGGQALILYSYFLFYGVTDGICIQITRDDGSIEEITHKVKSVDFCSASKNKSGSWSLLADFTFRPIDS